MATAAELVGMILEAGDDTRGIFEEDIKDTLDIDKGLVGIAVVEDMNETVVVEIVVVEGIDGVIKIVVVNDVLFGSTSRQKYTHTHTHTHTT